LLILIFCLGSIFLFLEFHFAKKENVDDAGRFPYWIPIGDIIVVVSLAVKYSLPRTIRGERPTDVETRA
jgi:hypothetical protein